MRFAGALLLVGITWAPVGHSSSVHPQRDNAPRVHLGYATYEGTTKSSGVNEFLGMRYTSPNMVA